jgi:CRP-like cAMP-binding protein
MSNATKTVLTFKRRDFLPQKTNCLWKIERGIIRTLKWNGRGKTFTIGFWGEGEIVGHYLSQIKSNPLQMQCLTAVDVSPLPIEDLAKIRSIELYTTSLSQLQRLETFLAIAHQKTLADRLVSLLDWLSRHFGRDVPEGRLLQLHLTHQVLAETLGASRVSISRLVKEFERSGQIRRTSTGNFLLEQQ